MTPEEAQSKFGRIIVFEDTPHGDIIFKSPARGDYARFVALIGDGKADKFSAMTQFIKACAVHPAAKDIDKVLDDLPGIIPNAANALQDLAGADLQSVVKKG